MSAILGISAFYHDSAAVMIVNGQIIAAAQEERFTRIKHDASFPYFSCKYCLEYSGYSIDQLDAVVFYDKPYLKFERLLETYYALAPRGLKSFIKAIPVWLNEKMFLKRIIKKELSRVHPFDRKKLKLLFPEHHLSHASSAFYPSSFDDAAILTIDGVGEWATATICKGSGSSIKVLRELRFPHSVGLLYSAFTYWLGFKVNSGEYKLMGLAPYGNPQSSRTIKYIELIKTHLVNINDDGSIWMDQSYFNYCTGLRMVNEKKWQDLFGFCRRAPESDIDQEHCDLAYAIQKVIEEIIIYMASEAKKLTGAKNLCMAGGVALNCVANGKLFQEGLFDKIFIQPAAGDAGGALGAAYAAYHLYFNKSRKKYPAGQDGMKGTFLGPSFSNLDIEQVSRKYKGVWEKFESVDLLTQKVADLIASGYIVGWFQGAMEFGPRALGHRSILADARNTEMQSRLNLKIKNRESFRPFAPSVLEEDQTEYFKLTSSSPYMLVVAEVEDQRREVLPENYFDLPLLERLRVTRSDIPAITHIDFSARVQSVSKITNKRYWSLINNFKSLTGYGVIINTSFNVRGEPIVCSPEDAYLCFMNTDMDYLVMEDYVFAKVDQPRTTQSSVSDLNDTRKH